MIKNDSELMTDLIRVRYGDYRLWNTGEHAPRADLNVCLTINSENGRWYNADFQLMYSDGSYGILVTEFDVEESKICGKRKTMTNFNSSCMEDEFKGSDILKDLARIPLDKNLLRNISSNVEVRRMLARAASEVHSL